MRKFGGSGRKKQCCRYRKCISLGPGTKEYSCVSMSLMHFFCPLASTSTLTAKTHMNSDQTHYAADATIQDKPTTFLAYHGRKLDSVLGDGNCMFQSLAKQLSGDSDKHGPLREKLCEFIFLNGEVLKGWLTDGVILEEHLRSICKPNTFGTQLELKAASTMFNLDIYVATNSLLRNSHYIWTKISPINPIFLCTFSDRDWPRQFNSERKC